MANYIKGKRVQTSNKGWLTTQGLTEAITPSEWLFFNKNVSGNLFSAKVCVLCPEMTPVLFTSGFFHIWGWPWPQANQAATCIIWLMQIQDIEGIDPKVPRERKPCLFSDAFQTLSHSIRMSIPQETGTQSKVPRSHTKEKCGRERSVGLNESNSFNYQQRL